MGQNLRDEVKACFGGTNEVSAHLQAGVKPPLVFHAREQG
jgi:hypothetical protein